MAKYLRYSVLLIFYLLLGNCVFGQFPYLESFRNSTAPGISFGGAPEAFLTAKPGTAPDGGSIDKEGEGFLRLTNNSTYQKGFVISNAEFPSRNGFTVIFEYYIYGGTGADGISLFLFDADVDSFNIGGFGGSLGYAQITRTVPPSAGVSKGYLAIGLDEFGNFSNPTEGRQGGTGFIPGSVTLRGRGNGTATTPDNYAFLTTSKIANYGFPLTVGGSTRQSDSTSAGYRRVYMDMVPNPKGGYNITVRVTRGGSPTTTATVINNFYYSEPAPSHLRYGIASSTGAQTNYHEIRNVFIDVYQVDNLVAPVANNDAVTVCSGKQAIIDVAANDVATNEGGTINKSSIDLDPTSAGIQSTYTVDQKGTFSFNSDGTVWFTPESAFDGAVTGYYTIKDSYGKVSLPATITVNYSSVLPQPDAGKDTLITTLSPTATYIMRGSNPLNNTGKWTQVSGPNTAVFSNINIQNPLVSNLTGGTYVFRWSVTTAAGCELFDDVQININHTPSAANDSITTSLNAITTIPILNNDTDPDGNNTIDKGSVRIIFAPLHGTVSIDPVTGVANYRPNEGYSGYDSFSYAVKDNFGAESNQATVSIAVNVKPEGTGDNTYTSSETPVKISVLVNDKGKTGAIVLKHTDPANGIVVVNPDSTITYTPTAGFSGKDSFTYKLKNKEGLESDPITVTVNVRPVGSSDSRTTPVNTSVSIAVKDNDISKTGTTVMPASTPLHGSISVNANGIITYTPANNYSGTDIFTYRLRAADGLESDAITVNIMVKGVPEKAPDIEADVSDGKPTVITIPVVPGSTVVITSPPKHGTVTIDPVTGEVIYTPEPGYTGPDDFSYVIRDPDGNESAPGRVIIEVSRPAKIGLAKALTSMTKNAEGSFNLRFTFTVVNYGDHRINQLSLTDDLAGVFPSATITVNSIRSDGTLVVNDAYNGSTNKELLLPSSYIAARWKEVIELEVTVVLSNEGGSYYNFAYIEGVAENTGNKTEDQSTNGLSPDPVNSGDPAPSELTPVKLVKQPLFVPGGFSPNGDGINDYFVVENAMGKQVSLEVFNRWGNRVYRSQNYQNDWNGRCTEGIHIGEDLPVGTYYFILVIDNKDKQVGYITINR
ncbi:Ig-like domain-containing protein [Arcticibacter tournemirensis]|uniref:Tandem-95 repeat protein n=1 Tax=Arcticibacter tournemirensis TaxID=699437 RepID=A0A4Q0MFY8_9SPHI|nr:Ig-like domain-containing protein [Arcticibacter tournemirensis]RXF72225.1 tandem-95 repeat protein [Arcticibacter tournemirensis]